LTFAWPRASYISLRHCKKLIVFTIQFDNYCVPIKTQQLQATDNSTYIQISQKPINQNRIFPSVLGDSQKFPYFNIFLLSAKPTNHI